MKRTIAAILLPVVAALAVAWTSAPGHMITMTRQDAFRPKNARVKPGDTVTWQNRDPQVHTVNSDTALFDSQFDFPGGLERGERWSWTVPEDAVPGTVYFYHCDFHGSAGDGSSFGTGMVGSITVK
jgi:plastocyanin